VKIIHVTASLSRFGAGVSQAAWDMARETRAQGHDVRFIGMRDEFTGMDLYDMPTSSYRACLPNFPRRYCHSPEMADVLREEAIGADIIHSHGLWLYPGLAARRQADTLRIPLIVSVHGMLEPWAIHHHSWKKRLAWRLFEHKNLRTATCLHATSEQEVANIRAIGLSNPVAIIPLGIDTAPYRSPAATPVIRHLRDATGGKRILLYFSRLHVIKGPDLLLDSWGRLSSHFPDWHLVLAGPDAEGYRAVLEDRARKGDLDGRVTFIGPVYEADKYALLAAADLFVLPSHSENFGVVVLEALAAGVPVLTTRGTPWSSLATHRCGWWVEQGVDSLAAAIEVALSTPPETLHDMGRRGRHLAETQYARPILTGKMIAAYEWICSGKDRPDGVIV